MPTAEAYPPGMRRLRPAVLLLAAGTTLLLVAPLGSFAGSSAEKATATTFTLQSATAKACAKPPPAKDDEVVGRACVDHSREIATWTVEDGKAGRVVPGQWTQSFTWTVPKTIAPGAGMTLNLKATWDAVASGQICPAITVTGSFASKQLLKCAESGKPADGSLAVKLVPPKAAPGTVFSLMVWLLDGPVYTYRYRANPAAAKPKGCRAPLRLPASASAEKACRYLVSFTFEQRQVIPCMAGVASAQIAPNGDVWTCCIRAEPMGNLREAGFDLRRVWNSPRADELRGSIRRGECHCPLANAAYSSMLCDPPSLWHVGWNMLKQRLRRPAAR